jgi:hypothetical protein
LETPKSTEPVVEVDGTNTSINQVKQALGL